MGDDAPSSRFESARSRPSTSCRGYRVRHSSGKETATAMRRPAQGSITWPGCRMPAFNSMSRSCQNLRTARRV